MSDSYSNLQVSTDGGMTFTASTVMGGIGRMAQVSWQGTPGQPVVFFETQLEVQRASGDTPAERVAWSTGLANQLLVAGSDTVLVSDAWTLLRVQGTSASVSFRLRPNGPVNLAGLAVTRPSPTPSIKAGCAAWTAARLGNPGAT